MRFADYTLLITVRNCFERSIVCPLFLSIVTHDEINPNFDRWNHPVGNVKCFSEDFLSFETEYFEEQFLPWETCLRYYFRLERDPVGSYNSRSVSCNFYAVGHVGRSASPTRLCVHATWCWCSQNELPRGFGVVKTLAMTNERQRGTWDYFLGNDAAAHCVQMASWIDVTRET